MRTICLVYGLLSHAFAMVTVVYAMGFLGGFVPKTVDSGVPASALGLAALCNMALPGVFALLCWLDPGVRPAEHVPDPPLRPLRPGRGLVALARHQAFADHRPPRC